jgi:hypothetical protein
MILDHLGRRGLSRDEVTNHVHWYVCVAKHRIAVHDSGISEDESAPGCGSKLLAFALRYPIVCFLI